MAGIAESEIEALARLCRLSLSADEVRRFAADLSGIVAHIQALQRVDVDGVEPFVGPELPRVELRDDEAAAPLPRERALACVPEHDDRFVLVPRFKDEEG